MVQINPDDYNSWNYLKRNLKSVKRHLELTQLAIQLNPKSYAAWHHRFYIFKENYEHKLCNILLNLDKRNFHCWNYCLKNGFENKLDLHNPSSMHFKEFNKSYLFIDPTDEAVWRCYEKQYEKTIAIENESIKILFDSPFTGDIKLNNRNITVLNPTKCIKTNLKDINTITDINI